ncbi:MAG: enoyl-CoA hydratase/isomerase family protein [Candidatus Riflebacteria bacterium]|nr:enoyl-CoA hydratase/isomerase family protein [Candidatus Riflebacteria bacterium]
MADFQTINYSLSDGVAVVAINNPPVNALGAAVFRDLEGIFNQLAADPSVKAVVLTGSGSIAFVAGADIKEIAEIGTPEDGERITVQGKALLDRIENFRVPVIAAINGVCLGGGVELAMACHVRISSDKAKFGQPEINLGIIPALGGTQRLPRIVGPSKATELILTGDLITAQEAKAIGLVNKVVPEAELLKQAKGLAKKIASRGRCAIEASMEAIRAAIHQPRSDGMAAESKIFGRLCATEDMREGVRAFIDKRQPNFKDR